MTTTLLGSDLPIAAAPMAGGPTTAALASAATRAGAFAFLPGGYLTPDRLADDVAAARAWGRPFGVNLFVPGPAALDRDAFAAYARRIAPEAAALDVALAAEPVEDDDRWADKLRLLVEDPVPVVSFTFGLPSAADVRALRRAGTVVLASVTTPEEAAAARDGGVDGLVVQGPAAGGHSATWDPDRRIADAPTSAVVRAVTSAVGLPVVAAGGVDGPDAVRDLLAAGAEAVAVGTLLLRTDESGASATYQAALATSDRGTVVTRAFTGRPARAVRNGFVDRHDDAAPVGYPAVHHLTRDLRRRAAAAGDAERLHLWAGTGYRQATTGPTADVVRALTATL
ncbi:nitronate monooxygenase [Promicromonospora sukumoe]|uniref:Propionate 3-nitronate monooxygenase n=1 Tax=Promicromonospora sukumoe TaxID=88382 RepID=A0A7W3J6K9_9MICO|nr:nitronate monooxygenase [Promicromonospora sukumoe]MBA8807228.1 NAD(P)H-dependent flavin oxidoreductase YrpB (nitropropane dioxygenase family) [Promicromonospora sukumoe]